MTDKKLKKQIKRLEAHSRDHGTAIFGLDSRIEELEIYGRTQPRFHFKFDRRICIEWTALAAFVCSVAACVKYLFF